MDSFLLYKNLVFSHYKKNVTYAPAVNIDVDLLRHCSYTTTNFKTQSNSSNVFLKSLSTLEEEEISLLEKKFKVSLTGHPLCCFRVTAEVLTCVQLTAQAAPGWIWKHSKASFSEKPPVTWHDIAPPLCKSIALSKKKKKRTKWKAVYDEQSPQLLW